MVELTGLPEIVTLVAPGIVRVTSDRGAGAGIVWDATHVVTNHHVVARSRPELVTAQGARVEARVVSSIWDLALLEIDAGLDLVIPQWAPRGAVRVGEPVLAIGHPWGEPHVVTWGIVSSVGGEREDPPLIRTDALLAPGNSGGPLVDMDARIVGVNTMVSAGGRGLAIPGWAVKRFVEEALRPLAAKSTEVLV